MEIKLSERNTDTYYRAGVGVVLFNPNTGLVLLGERKVNGNGIEPNFQFIQGGVESGDTYLETALKETYEEAGIKLTSEDLISELPELTAYDLSYLSRKSGRGQVHKWLVFRYEGEAEFPETPQDDEFECLKWMTFDQAIESTTEFRKGPYRRVLSMIKEEGGINLKS